MVIFKNGRVYANDGVDTPDNGVNEFLREKHTTSDILDFMKRTQNNSAYDADNSKEFSADELESSKHSAANPITIYDRKELKNILNSMDEIDEKLNSKND